MEKPMNAAAKKGLPSHAERPDLYDGFNGLEHAPGWKNPVAVPSRLQALIAERQATAEAKKPARKAGWKLPAKATTIKAAKTVKPVKKTFDKKLVEATPKRESRTKVAAVG